MTAQIQEKSSRKNVVFVFILLTACGLGLVGIFIFILGLSSNHVVNFTLQTVIEMAVVV
ncbi:MAG: hypothetical protein WCH62_06120 [Candidatus Omnitrophota bacterium]